MTAAYSPAVDWNETICRCGHDDLTHTARLAVGGLIYGECFAQAADQPVCTCLAYVVRAS